MQHTNQYQFNLIESGDNFSAQPLNENAEKMETALAEQAETIAQCGNCKIFYGEYIGDGAYGRTVTRQITFPFIPKIVIVKDYTQPIYCTLIAVPGQEKVRIFAEYSGLTYSDELYLTWADDSLSWSAEKGATYALNAEGRKYYYFAIA